MHRSCSCSLAKRTCSPCSPSACCRLSRCLALLELSLYVASRFITKLPHQLTCIRAQNARTLVQTLGSPIDPIWVIASIALPTMFLSPIYAQAAEVWGYKSSLMVSTTLGFVGCMVIGVSQTSFAKIIFGHALIGCGLGAQALIHITIAKMIEYTRRSFAQAIVVTSSNLGAIAGFLVIRPLSTNPSWFKYYTVAMALYGIAGVAIFATYHPYTTTDHSVSRRDRLARLDWLGYLLLLFTLTLPVGLVLLRTLPTSAKEFAISSITIGTVCLCPLILYGRRPKAHAILQRGLFGSQQELVLAMACAFGEGAAFFAAVIYTLYQITKLHEVDFLLAGLRCSVAFVSSTFASLWTAFYMNHHRKFRTINLIGLALYVVFFVLMISTDLKSGIHLWGYPVFFGFGLGISTTALPTRARNSVLMELESLATSLLILARSFGGVVGIVICKS